VLLHTEYVREGRLVPTVHFKCDPETLERAFIARQAKRGTQGYAEEDASVLSLFDLSIMEVTHGLSPGRAIPEPPLDAHYRIDLFPRLYDRIDAKHTQFPELIQPEPGIYPIVETLDHLSQMLEAGAKLLQLRTKSDVLTADIRAMIQEAIVMARDFPDAQLFINDFWKAACDLGAFGVHLGQEDLLTADIQAIAAAGLRLGVSSHAYWEVARAIPIGPSYIACGPIFPTKAKRMPWLAQGVGNLAYWTRLLPLPVIGIGGITAERLDAVSDSGCAAASMISEITMAPDPKQAFRSLQEQWLARRRLAFRAGPETGQADSLARPTLPQHSFFT
jgi:hydroxymethylpyrimidine kinase/phosphomethylpyrimidine kinase/thiamine-phosphate diphosphorylase